MIILGIDPGLQKTGYGVIHQEGNYIKALTYGTIKPPVSDPMSERLCFLHTELRAILEEFRPHQVAIEETFVNKNPVSTLKLGHARGALMMTPALLGIPVFEYGANKVKKSIVGAGHASKEQMLLMVKRLLPQLTLPLTEDSADALAVAICHSHHMMFTKKLI
jgi:crossover junction endodeoxyribonuclease RuvC